MVTEEEAGWVPETPRWCLVPRGVEQSNIAASLRRRRRVHQEPHLACPTGPGVALRPAEATQWPGGLGYQRAVHVPEGADSVSPTGVRCALRPAEVQHQPGGLLHTVGEIWSGWRLQKPIGWNGPRSWRFEAGPFASYVENTRVPFYTFIHII